jgi:hypothetical protein
METLEIMKCTCRSRCVVPVGFVSLLILASPHPYRRRAFLPSLIALPLLALSAGAATVSVTWNFATDVPIAAASHSAAGNTIDFTLDCVPAANELMAVSAAGVSALLGKTVMAVTTGQSRNLAFCSEGTAAAGGYCCRSIFSLPITFW